MSLKRLSEESFRRSRSRRRRLEVEVLEDRTLLSFLAAPSYALGSIPASAAVGDFNGDGIPDLAIANGSYSPPGSVSILLGKGDGTFQNAVQYAVESPAFSVAIGDFNGDGHPDLAVSTTAGNGDNRVSVLLGNGDGTFGAAQSYAMGSFSGPVTLGDFNGDGHLDLAAAGNSMVYVVLGNGDGTFGPVQSYPVGPRTIAVGVGDFNGDGHLDIAAAGDGTVKILLNNGDGTFGAAQTYADGGREEANPVAVAVADFNGDGHSDLAIVDGTVSILLGNGDGTFQPPQSYLVRAPYLSIAVGDFNGDGNADLALPDNFSAAVIVLPGKGDGTFGVAQRYAVGAGPNSLAAADFNQDGHLDLIVTNSYSRTLSVLLGQGDGTFQAARSYATDSGAASVAVGDFNGDGIPDLAVANSGSNSVSVLLGKGDGTFGAAQSYPAGQGTSFVAVGDFNGDGNPDLAVVNQGTYPNFHGTLTILLGRGDGTFQVSPSFDVGTTSMAVAVGDFNRDGILDLAVVNAGSNTMSILLGNGDGTFQSAHSYSVGTDPVSVTVGDFNGDGILDVVVANYGSYPQPAGTLSIFLGNGDGTFQAAKSVAAGYGPFSVAVGDFNGDGVSDLVTTNYLATFVDRYHIAFVERDVRVFLGNGDGTFQDAHVYTAGVGPHSVAVADFNGDGHLDLAVADGYGMFAANNTVSVLLGNGDGTFQPAQDYDAGASAWSVAVSDFNRDGYPDLAVANNNPGTVTVLVNAADWGRGPGGASHGRLPSRLTPVESPLVLLFSTLPAAELQLPRALGWSSTEQQTRLVQQFLLDTENGEPMSAGEIIPNRFRIISHDVRDAIFGPWADPELVVFVTDPSHRH